MNGSVTVVMPAFNAAPYIAETINSVLRQSVAAEKIIVADDGSTDDTAEIVKEFPATIELNQVVSRFPEWAGNDCEGSI